jgi:hypothetical protein
MTEKMIDLGIATDNGRVHNLTSKQKGLDLRVHFALDDLDDAEGSVEVIVPEDIYAISPSFVLGLFSGSLKEFGSPDGFFSHYNFSADSDIREQIEEGVELYFVSRSALDKSGNS